MSADPISEDPSVEEGSVQMAEVTVTQYMRPDGSIGIRTWYDGDSSISGVLGLLAMGGIHIYERCEH